MSANATLEDKRAAVAQCRPAIKTIRGIRSREESWPCRLITTLNIEDFPGAPSLDNGSFQFLLKEADGLPIRVDTTKHENFVFVVVATDEEELNREIESLFLLDAYEAAGIKVPKKLRDKAKKEEKQKKRH